MERYRKLPEADSQECERLLTGVSEGDLQVNRFGKAQRLDISERAVSPDSLLTQQVNVSSSLVNASAPLAAPREPAGLNALNKSLEAQHCASTACEYGRIEQLLYNRKCLPAGAENIRCVFFNRHRNSLGL
jgi:hypothetical protein